MMKMFKTKKELRKENKELKEALLLVEETIGDIIDTLDPDSFFYDINANSYIMRGAKIEWTRDQLKDLEAYLSIREL